ncbi:MAG: hypothetical protein KGK03_00710 [Candidatus Omnitrophica bacterium]|nr:hypothetical protein [Candidatus Omnitrophota bacterium]
MFLRSGILAVVLLISGGIYCQAQGVEEASNPGPGVDELIHKQLNLAKYEAVLGDLSSCAGDPGCIADAAFIKNTACAAAACRQGKDPVDCFSSNEISYNSMPQKARIMDSICAWIKSPSPETRQAVLQQIPNATDRDLAGQQAYLAALQGSAEKCQDIVKNYIGPYGPAWTTELYVTLSGCRILAKETTVQEEERSFLIWFEVSQGKGQCADIPIPEMQKACSSPGAVVLLRGTDQYSPVNQ